MTRAIVAGVLVGMLLVGCATAPRTEKASHEKDDDVLSAYDAIEIEVHGLSCPLCSNNLDGQLRRIDGVKEAVIDLKTGVVTVSFVEGHQVMKSQIAKAVYDAGFTLKEVRTRSQ